MAQQKLDSLSLRLEEVAALKSKAVRQRDYVSRVSLPLAIRLLDTSDPYFDCFSVLDELDYLEGLRKASRTKRAAPFRQGSPLYPFWHKHFFCARHLIKNIGVRWNIDQGRKGNKDLGRLIQKVATRYGDDPSAWQGHLVHNLIPGGFEERAAQGLTGDWIIYAIHEDQNYYLDLATHEEGQQEGGKALHEKLRGGCRAEFPFLFA